MNNSIPHLHTWTQLYKQTQLFLQRGQIYFPVFFGKGIHCCSWKMWDLKREGSGKFCWWSSRVKTQSLGCQTWNWGTRRHPTNRSGNHGSRNSELRGWDSRMGPREMLTFASHSSPWLCKSHQTPKGMKLVRSVAQRNSSKSLMATIDMQGFQ